MSQSSNPSREDEIRGRIEEYKTKRKRIIATFLLGMLGIYVLPFRNIILVLAIITLGIVPSMGIYYTWRKRQLEKELEKEKLF